MPEIQVGRSKIAVTFDKSFQTKALSAFLDKIILDEKFRAKATKAPLATLKKLGIKISEKDQDKLKGVTIADAMKASSQGEQGIIPLIVIVLVVVAVFLPE